VPKDATIIVDEREPMPRKARVMILADGQSRKADMCELSGSIVMPNRKAAEGNIRETISALCL